MNNQIDEIQPREFNQLKMYIRLVKNKYKHENENKNINKIT